MDERATLTDLQLWMLRHGTRSLGWVTKVRGVAYGTVKNTWQLIYRNLGVPGGIGKRKRLNGIIRALELGFIEIEELDTALDERDVPPEWCAERYEQLIVAMNDRERSIRFWEKLDTGKGGAG